MITTERATDLADWPDPEILVIAALADLAPTATEVPADPDDTYAWLPMLRVHCFGGNDGNDLATDLFRVDVDAFAATKTEAAQLAGAARQRLLNFPISTDRGVIDTVSTSTRPNEVPYGDVTKVRRYTASYAGRTRR